MAAVAVPLVEALAPSIISLIAGLVHQKAPVQEAALGASTGPVKFANLFVDVMSDLAKAKAAGQIDSIPNDTDAKNVIQSVISSMKLLGLLDGAAVPDAPAPALTPKVVQPTVKQTSANSQSFALVGGQTLTVSVA